MGHGRDLRRAFRADHPRRDRTVFLAMRFEQHPLRNRIHRNVCEVGERLDFDIVRADDRDYSGELWTNVRVCMEESALAIAIYDSDGVDEPNLAFELGFLIACKTPCLILRERRCAPPPAMLAHRLQFPFEALDVEGTLTPAVEGWLRTQDGDDDA